MRSFLLSHQEVIPVYVLIALKLEVERSVIDAKTRSRPKLPVGFGATPATATTSSPNTQAPPVQPVSSITDQFVENNTARLIPRPKARQQ